MQDGKLIGKKSEVVVLRGVLNGMSAVTRRMHHEDIDAHLVCPTCLEVFCDPCTVSPCGHTFCHHCLTSWIDREPSAECTCPLCSTPVRECALSYSLKGVLEALHAPALASRRERLGLTECRKFSLSLVKPRHAGWPPVGIDGGQWLPRGEQLLLVEWLAACFVFFSLAMRLVNIFEEEASLVSSSAEGLTELFAEPLRTGDREAADQQGLGGASAEEQAELLIERLARSRPLAIDVRFTLRHRLLAGSVLLAVLLAPLVHGRPPRLQEAEALGGGWGGHARGGAPLNHVAHRLAGWMAAGEALAFWTLNKLRGLLAWQPLPPLPPMPPMPPMPPREGLIPLDMLLRRFGNRRLSATVGSPSLLPAHPPRHHEAPAQPHTAHIRQRGPRRNCAAATTQHCALPMPELCRSPARPAASARPVSGMPGRVGGGLRHRLPLAS